MKSKTVIQRILSEMYEKIKNAYTKFKKKIRQRKKKILKIQQYVQHLQYARYVQHVPDLTDSTDKYFDLNGDRSRSQILNPHNIIKTMTTIGTL